MMGMRWMAAVSALTLAGCSTYGFGPPQVSESRRTVNQDVSETCEVPIGGVEIERNAKGARDLIENYIGAYRCAMRLAADGRQAWQVPGFLSLVTAAAAVALGGGRDWAIAGGSANSMFTAGNSYYDPAKQAEILNDAVDAFACIRSEAVGVEAYVKAPAVANAPARAEEDEAEKEVAAARAGVAAAEQARLAAEQSATRTANELSRVQSNFAIASTTGDVSSEAAARLGEARQAIDSLQAEADLARTVLVRSEANLSRRNDVLTAARSDLVRAKAAVAALGEIEISSEEQYFHLVASRLEMVEAAAATRLSQRGSINAQGVVDQIEALKKKIDDAEAAANAAGQGTGGAGTEGEGEGDRSAALNRLFGNKSVAGLGAGVGGLVDQVRLEINVLRPKLDKCVLRAQI